MARFFVDKKDIKENYITIAGSEAHHIGTVLRLGINDEISLFDQNGAEYRGIIVEKSRRTIRVKIKSKTPCGYKAPISIVLGQALVKGKKMDIIVQKATELGAAAIIPFCSMRSIPRIDERSATEKVAHWQKIAVEAAKQSGRLPAPQVEPVQEFREIIHRDFDGFLKIILWEEETERALHAVLTQNPDHTSLLCLVGPEGGFAQEEVNSAMRHGFIPVSLGKAILRTETASIALLAILQYEAGVLG